MTVRKVIGRVFFLVGAALVVLYSIAGFLAYQNNFDGWARFLGVGSPISALGLPFWGRGEVWGFEVRSYVWWWLFGGAMASFLVASFLLGRLPNVPDIGDDSGPDIGDIADLF